MGAVDLVVQVESPPSVASGLQRVGRAGHQVGQVSRGVLLPKHRGDLVHTAVAVERMRAGAIEALRVPAQPARRARPARGGRHRRRRVGRRRALRRGATVRAVHDAAALGVRRDARPARRPLPLRRVRRAATAHRLGPRGRHADRPAGRPAARRHQRRHDPGPRAVRGVPGRRDSVTARVRRRLSCRRARRGDGLRVAGRRRVHPRLDHRGGSRTSPTTGCWSPPLPASPGGCRSGRATRSAGRPSSARRSARSPASSPR